MKKEIRHPLSAPVNQLGCVVPDLESAIQGWVKLGVGPFLAMRDIGLDDYVYHGQPSRPKIDVAFAQTGDLQVELIHPVGDVPSSYHDFLAAGRSGIHHLGWFLDDYDAAVEAAGREGHRAGPCRAAAGRASASPIWSRPTAMVESRN